MDHLFFDTTKVNDSYLELPESIQKHLRSSRDTDFLFEGLDNNICAPDFASSNQPRASEMNYYQRVAKLEEIKEEESCDISRYSERNPVSGSQVVLEDDFPYNNSFVTQKNQILTKTLDLKNINSTSNESSIFIKKSLTKEEFDEFILEEVNPKKNSINDMEHTPKKRFNKGIINSQIPKSGSK